MNIKCLDLCDLGDDTPKRPRWNKVFGEFCAQAASACIENEGHQVCVEMVIDGDYNERVKIQRLEISDADRAFHNDMERSAEFGAYGISSLIFPELTEFTVIEVSRKGTGFDFWLGSLNDPGLLFQKKARLEVSGILKGDKYAIQRRVNIKLKQISPTDNLLPGYVSIVEFGSLIVRIEKKQ